MRLLVATACCAALLASFGGCGPMQSTAYFLDAEEQLAAAKAAGAAKSAPYEWTAANLYLTKAREEVGYADYEVALDFAKKAAQHAADARKKATAAIHDGPPPPPTVK